ncbi:SPOR domain-containing protein [Pseudoalteromonas sp. C2R02]|uniref:SPOR domain-containing protein n=1 Tax=Pseudoalteromonas sp. C2R02 TaxID=2841565 RepID=UPI001C07F69A|nr:SPOR domain-containing protein [Pseudoalteromonas sp. C2R02]
MNSGFINRLVGTTIVVIAAVVFIPNILDGEKVQFKEGFKTIPDRPEFKTVDLDLEQAQADLEFKLPDTSTEIVDEIALDITPSEIANTQVKQVDTATEVVTTNTTAKSDVVEVSTFKPEPKVEKRAKSENLTDFAYVIQLGSFSHKANVASLLAKLKKAGFTTFTKPISTPSGQLTKVFVGPMIKKSALERKLPALKTLTGLNGKVTVFDVTK